MSKTVKTNDSNWRKLKHGQIKAEQTTMFVLQERFEICKGSEKHGNKD